ncbi:MAG: hypothetical protein AAGF11_37220 [Myxococcota bacterium]
MRWTSATPASVLAYVLVPLSAPVLVGVTACGSDEPVVPGQAEGSGSSGTALGSGTTGETSTTDSPVADETGGTEGTPTGEPEPDPEFEPYPARGIRLTEVYADHGVSVPVVVDGQWVDGDNRNAVLIRGRDTLIRGFWALDPDFEPRPVQGRLTLSYPDGTQEVATKIFEVEGPSVPADLDTNVYFIVPGEMLVPGVRFQIELLETTDDLRDTPEPPQAAYPPEPSLLGIEGVEMVLNVVIVPIDHDIGPGCPEPPEVNEQELEFLSEQLFMQNPVERVEIERRDTIAYTSGLGSFGGLLSFLADLRVQDGADPAAYYYGVVRPCDGGPSGVGGQAISIPGWPTVNNAWTRTSVGRWTNSLSNTANTFVHEVGHTQGRRHVACNGNEGGVDPSYPYPSGNIGVWGFGSFDFTMRSPSSKDYMTYCGNTWVGDWGWGQVAPFIREISSWGAAGAVPSMGQVLVGLVDPNGGDRVGHEAWFVAPGDTQGLVRRGSEALTLVSDQGRSTRVEAIVTPMGEGEAYAVVAPLPPELDIARQVEISRQHAGQRREVRVVQEVRVGGRVVSVTR